MKCMYIPDGKGSSLEFKVHVERPGLKGTINAYIAISHKKNSWPPIIYLAPVGYDNTIIALEAKKIELLEIDRDNSRIVVKPANQDMTFIIEDAGNNIVLGLGDLISTSVQKLKRPGMPAPSGIQKNSSARHLNDLLTALPGAPSYLVS